MKIIFDFDHTVFNMSLMHEQIIEVLEMIGVSREEYLSIYEDVTRWRLFTVKALAQRIERRKGIDRSEIISALETVVEESAKYVYDDVIQSMKHLKEEGHKIFLLSWGDPSWQEKKLKHSGLAEYVDEAVCVAQMKADYLKQMKRDDEILVMVDDKPAEISAIAEEHPDISCIRIKRKDSKYADQPTPAGIPEASDMRAVMNFIRTIS